MTQNIKPTRSELMELKRKISLAINGYNLLKKKRDGLIIDFFQILKKVKQARTELLAEFNNSIGKLNMARMLESDIKIKSIALAVGNSPPVDVGKKNIMGVVVPSIGEIALQKTALERGYGLYGSAAIDEAAASYEKVIERLVAIAETEVGMRKILKEIEKTKRRVNALEFEVIPSMQKTKAFIQLRLEEAERENTFRMKRIKKKRAKSK